MFKQLYIYGKRIKIVIMYKCKNCKFYDKEVGTSGKCTAWGYGKSCHSTYSKCYACDYFELKPSKNSNNG
jgi:hypothetical protein